MPSRDSIASGETISVEGNQNVYGVAQKYGVPMREIIVLNNLQPPYAIKPGQSLVLPAKAGGVGGIMTSSTMSSATGVGSAPVSGVQQADLAPVQPSAVQSEELPPPPPPTKVETLGGKTAPNDVKSSPVEALNAPTVQAKPVTTTVAQAKMDQGIATAAPTSITPATAPKPVVVAPPPVAPASDDTTASTPIDMVWPVQGTVLSGFGPKGQGLNNDGVNIAAPKGSPVVAAANGIVVYAGNEMKGFGNLVLIRHQGGWVTAYADLDRMLVNKDAVVAQGDMIGTVGKTGNVSSPQLHFETRYKDKPVDPNSIVKDSN
jgi:murein DD-endopeptidase MepM/ murein hydrolase activator NlpD